MNKNVIKYIAIAILLVPMVSFAESTPAPSTTPSTGNSQSTATAETPSTGDSSSTATPTTPSTGGSSSTATDSTPSTGGSNSTATPTTPSTGGSSSTATNTNTTPSNPSTGGGSSGSSSSSSSSSSGSRVSIYGCPMLTSYLKYGANNDSVQVAKLQSFLSNYEKMNVKVTGIFDKQTEAAVSAFQTKYSSDIMGPWNKTTGTGYVYITTLKKINQIACNIPLTLNMTERSLINEVLTRKSSVAKTTIVTPDNSNQIEIKGNNDNTNTTVFEIETSGDESNTALVSKSTVSGKFWNFIKSLFR